MTCFEERDADTLRVNIARESNPGPRQLLPANICATLATIYVDKGLLGFIIPTAMDLCM